MQPNVTYADPASNKVFNLVLRRKYLPTPGVNCHDIPWLLLPSPNKVHYFTFGRIMAVGRIFSRGGQLWNFSMSSQKYFSSGGQQG